MKQQRIYLQNIQAAYGAQYQKSKQSNQKIGERSKQVSLQRKHTDDQNKCVKMLKITNYQRNANQNYNEVSPHTGQNGSSKSLQIIHVGESMEKREPFHTVGENVNWCSHYEEQYVGSLKN